MTKKLTATITLLLILTAALCGCLSQPYAEQVITKTNPSNGNSNNSDNENPSTATRVLYVSGAVQTDGYITVPQVCDYKTVLQIVGITDYTVAPNNSASVIPANVDRLIVDFKSDDVKYDSVNVNGGFVTLRQSIDGVDDSIVSKLADFIETNGKITNRSQLALALGDDYAANYYKFYIDMPDYA